MDLSVYSLCAVTGAGMRMLMFDVLLYVRMGARLCMDGCKRVRVCACVKCLASQLTCYRVESWSEQVPV